MEGIYQDMVHYEKCYNVFIRLSRRYEEWFDWIGTIFTDNILDEFVGDHSGALKLLGIGCYTGVIDYDIVWRFSKRYPQIKNTLVEPGATITMYQKLVADKPISGVTFYWHQKTWNKFVSESRPPSEKFDFISAISVIYYMKNWQQDIIDMYNCLTENGLLMITVSAEGRGVSKLNEAFPSVTYTANLYLNSKVIEDFLTSRKISFKTIRHVIFANVSPCFQEGNSDGPLMMDFLTHVKNFEQKASLDVVSKFKSFLKHGECSRQDGENIMLDCSIDIIVIKKMTPK